MYAARRTRCWWNLATILVVAGVFCLLVKWFCPLPDTREVLLKRNLHSLRLAVEVFRVQHAGVYPAARTATAQEFHDQMLLPTNRAGDTAPTAWPGYRIGPYFVEQLPANPLSGAREVWVVADRSATTPDERVEVRVCGRLHRAGWIYSPQTGRVEPNSSGRSSAGIPWQEL